MIAGRESTRESPHGQPPSRVGRHDRLFRVWGGGGGGQLSRDAPARRSGGVRGRPPAAGRGGGWAGFGPTLLEIAVDAREAILVAARRNNLPIDASKLTVKPKGVASACPCAGPTSSSSSPARPRWPFRSGWTVRSSSDPDRGLITGEPCHGHCRMELSPERLTDLRENARVPRQARDQSGEAGRREEADDQGRAGPLGARQRG